MLSTDEQKKICAKYRKRGNDGLVRCNQCPLVISVGLCMCHANSHYDPDRCEFVLDDNCRELKLGYPNEPMYEEKIMPEIKEVVDSLAKCITVFGIRDCSECKYNHYDSNYCQENLMRDALELLKAQEPVKPDVDVDTWICGKCGHKLEHQEMLGTNVLFHEQYSYCPNCGKAVKWDD